MSRDVGTIAAEVISDLSSQLAQRARKPAGITWRNLVPHASPYLEAMLALDRVSDKYGADSGEEIIQRCLSNLGQYRGEKARKLKKELNDLINEERKRR